MRRKWLAITGSAGLAALSVFCSIVPATAEIPSKMTVTLDNCKAAGKYSAERKGVSMLVMQNGKIIFEDYPNGHSSNEPHELASGTKSFAGVAAIAAMEDGILSLDEKVSDTIKEWKTDPKRKDITIRQLLNLVGGIKSTSGIAPTYAEALEAEVNAAPGETFQYGAQSFQIFGEVMLRKLAKSKENLLDYLNRRIFKPADIHYGFWRKSLNGQPLIPQGGGFTAREWAKFGEMLRLGGKVGDKQIIKAEDIPILFTGTRANPMYGLTFWLNRPIEDEKRSQIKVLTMASDLKYGVHGVPDDLVMAAGAGKQRLYICPSLGLIVVRQANGIGEAMARRDATGYSDIAFWQLLTEGKADKDLTDNFPASDQASKREVIMRLFDLDRNGKLDVGERERLKKFMEERRSSPQ